MAEPIRYTVDLRDRVHHLVRVTLRVPADLATGARVVLSVWTPGSYVVRDYVRHVQWCRARDVGGQEIELLADGGTAWRLPEDVTGPVDVELELYANELSVRTNHVDDHHALLIPAATFPYVEGGEDRSHEVHLPPFPAHHRVESLLPAGAAADTYVAEDRDHLIDSAFEVGDLPTVDIEVAGVDHRFVWAGHGGALDRDRIASDVAAIAEACRALFGGRLPTAGYTFLATGWDQGGGGLEHRDGAVLQIPVRVFQDDELYHRFQSLLTHEYLHLWNVKRLVPASLVQPSYDHPTRSTSLWVAEGWTAYYDELLPTRAGLWEARRLLDTIQDTWNRLLRMPGLELQSLRQASYEAWTKHYVRDENAPNAMTDYYAHGSLVALELDLRLRAAVPGGDGLDDVLRLLWERHAENPGGYTEADVLAAVAAVGGDALATLVDRRVGEPGLPQLEDVVATLGLSWQASDAPSAPDLGIQTSDADTGVSIGSVRRDGPAWRAGVTGGDRLLAIDDRTVTRESLDATLRIYDGGDVVEVGVARGPRLLRLPVTLGEPRPRLELIPADAASPAQRQAFERWAGHPLAS